MPQEEPDEIVVTAIRRGGSRHTGSHVRTVIRIDADGTGDFSDILPASLRSLFNIATDFDIDETFTAKQKEIIIKAIEGIADHPQLAAALAELAGKNVDINIMPVTRPFEHPYQPERAFVPPGEPDVASGILEYFQNDFLIAPPEFG